MELAIKLPSNDKTIGSNTVQHSKAFNSKSPATRAKKGEQLVSMMPAIKKDFALMGDGIVELFSEKEKLRGKIDEKWFEESTSKPLKQFDDRKRANLIMSKMEKQMKENTVEWQI